jgi:hypothetical protein
MNLGDLVIHHGRRYLLRGLDSHERARSAGVPRGRRDGEQVTAPVDELEPEAAAAARAEASLSRYPLVMTAAGDA